jgi:hypothetical protein
LYGKRIKEIGSEAPVRILQKRLLASSALPLLVTLVLVNVYILFMIPTMARSLFTSGAGGHLP